MMHGNSRVAHVLAGGLVASCALLAQARAGDRALIIGIDRYAGLDQDSQLTASVNDARLIERLAGEQWGFKPEQIRLLLNEQASADAIRASLASWLVDGTTAGDRAFFYFSGHGYFVPDKDGDEPDGKDETLVAHDARPTPNGYVNMVTDDEVREQLDKLKDRSVMVIADSCHSGTITRALDPARLQGASIEKSPKWSAVTRGAGSADRSSQIVVTREEFAGLRRGNTFFRQASGEVAWTAVAATEVAQEDVTREPRERNGVFTRDFVEGIRNRAADGDRNGAVSAAELLQFVRARSREYCASNRCSTGMTPTLESAGPDLARDMLAWPRPGSNATPPLSNADAGTEALPPAMPTTLIPTGPGSFPVRLEIVPGHTVELGKEIKLSVVSSKPGYLIVFDMHDSGKVVQLFPSVCSPRERMLRADAALTMPDPTYGCAFTASEHGKGQIIAIVSEDAVPVDELLVRNKGLEVVADPRAYIAEILHAILAVWTGDERNRAVRWGVATAPYEVR